MTLTRVCGSLGPYHKVFVKLQPAPCITNYPMAFAIARVFLIATSIVHVFHRGTNLELEKRYGREGKADKAGMVKFGESALFGLELERRKIR